MPRVAGLDGHPVPAQQGTEERDGLQRRARRAGHPTAGAEHPSGSRAERPVRTLETAARARLERRRVARHGE